MRKILLPAFAAICLCSSCYTSQPLETKKSDNNRTYEVDYLFEHEGCKVYRFYDYGYVYFTNCNGETIRKGDSTRPKTRSINRKVEQ
jgi:hypothetical protein